MLKEMKNNKLLYLNIFEKNYFTLTVFEHLKSRFHFLYVKGDISERSKVTENWNIKKYCVLLTKIKFMLHEF